MVLHLASTGGERVHASGASRWIGREAGRDSAAGCRVRNSWTTAPSQRSKGLRATSPFLVQMASETVRPVTLIAPPTKHWYSWPDFVRTL